MRPALHPGFPGCNAGDRCQALQELATVAPVLVLTTTEHADVTPTPGMTLLTGNGKLGSVGIRLVTEVSTPLMLSVVVSFSVVTPVQVAVPVTATLVALTAVFVLPVQFTVGRAGNAAAMAGLAPSAPN